MDHPVICAIIFASEYDSPSLLWQTGIDIQVDRFQDDASHPNTCCSKNYGPKKYFLYGPCCRYQGKTIPRLMFCSPNACITGKIPVEIFKNFDVLEVFPQSEGPKPCIVVDHHETQLHLSFLEYVNNDTPTWDFSLIIPYLTHLGHVGDSIEQKICFKIYWTKAKDELLQCKI